jgi:GrpB-like predicted nucleotidyltransferase (UPF0157 family)
MVDVVRHDPRWAASFADVARTLTVAVQEIPGASVEHVGSTAVPGLPAKPIIDIDIIVPSSWVKAATTSLEKLGYLAQGENGITGRFAFTAPDTKPPRNVYVCVAGGLAVRNHLALRDLLRSSEEARDVYTRAKEQLASDPDIDVLTYASRKSETVRGLLARTGKFSQKELDTIFAANR